MDEAHLILADDITDTPKPAAPPAGGKGVFIETWGCQMNVYDSERMAEVLAPLGYHTVDSRGAADLVVLNTCHIRELATEKVYSELGRLRVLKAERLAQGRDFRIGVAGCVAQAEGAEILRRAPSVDFVMGPQMVQDLPDLIAGLGGNASADERIRTDFAPHAKFKALGIERGKGGFSAFVSVQEGCDKFCTFCVVPYTRGAEHSRPVRQILDEVRNLVDQGVREVTLLGQNVNAYHGQFPDGGSCDLADLMAHLAEIEGLARIRFMTSHPNDMSNGLIAAFGNNPKLMPFLHLPVQSGSDRILALMNRKHTIAHYRETLARVKEQRPDIALSSDFITGFPGESDADFEATMALVREIGFAIAYSFRYSPRPGTPAAEMDNQVPEDVKAERLTTLQAELFRQQTAFNLAQVGKVLPVLFTNAGRNDGQIQGRSPYLQAVNAPGAPEMFGKILPVKITRATQNSLFGEVEQGTASGVS